MNDEADRRVGWVDLDEGLVVIERTERRAEFEQVLEDYLALTSTPAAGSHRRVETVAGPAQIPGEVPDQQGPVRIPHQRGHHRACPPAHDLTATVAGVSARAQDLRAADPVRSLLDSALGVKSPERNLRVGAAGEQLVGAELARLGSGWSVLHAVPIGTRGADTDHLVVGPPGVFTINSKHHPDGRVWVAGDVSMVNGQKVWYVPNARHEATRASGLLAAATDHPVQVAAIVAVVGAGKLTIREQPEDVTILTADHIRDHLLDLEPVLSPAAAQQISRAAARSDTWTTRASNGAASGP